MKTMDERIRNLPNSYLNYFYNLTYNAQCLGLLCRDCPMFTEDGCLCTVLHRERLRRQEIEDLELTWRDSNAK